MQQETNTPETLRARAEHVRWLAWNLSDVTAQRALLDMATELETRAETLDGTNRGSTEI